LKIKTRLRINALISLGVLVLILASLAWSYFEMSSATRKMDLVAEMRKVAFERIILRDDYILNHEERGRIQWNAKSETLKGLMESAFETFTNTEDLALLKEVQANYIATFILFSRFMKKTGKKEDNFIEEIKFTEADSRLIGQVFLRAYSLTDNINKLYESALRARTSARDNEVIIILVSLISGVIALIINSALIGKILTNRLTALGKGVALIGAGNFDYRIATEGNDELTALALASNEMAMKLGLSYTSIRSLESEIEQRKRTESALRETTEHLNNLIDQANAPIMVWDPQFRITRFNHAFENLTGRQATDVIGNSLQILFPSDQVEVSMETIRKTQTGERWEAVEIHILHIDETISIVLWNSATIFAMDGITPIATIAQGQDITNRKVAEEQLQRTLADLERSNKELEQFAYVASHDLQEPLRMVSSYTQLLAQRYEGQLDEKAKKYIDYAVDGAVRMQGLINDLLAYSRVNMQGGTFESVDSHLALGAALRNLSAAMQENGALVINDDLPTVQADTSQLTQVFQNLIGNAIKFRGTDPPRIQVSAGDLGHEWCFSVKDNGIGIDAKYADKIFVIFQRLHTRQEYPGTGIGLAICKRIVERHRGRIWFESEFGQGSIFYFTLPKC